MIAFHIDTESLLEALSIYSSDAQPTEKAELVAALEIANLLIAYDFIVYDGRVRGGQKERLDQLMDATEARLEDPFIQTEFRRRIVPVSLPDMAREQRAASVAVSDASSWSFLDCRTIVSKKARPLSDPELYLYPYLGRESIPEVDEIEFIWRGVDNTRTGHPRITGGRFYYSMLRNPCTYHYLSKHHAEHGPLTHNQLNHLFSRFRMDFAASRSIAVPELLPAMDVTACYTLPAPSRRLIKADLARRIASDASLLKDFAPQLRQMECAIAERHDCDHLLASQSKLLPLCLRFATGYPDVARNKKPSALLRAALAAHLEKVEDLSHVRRVAEQYDELDAPKKHQKVTKYIEEILGAKLDVNSLRNSDLKKVGQAAVTAAGLSYTKTQSLTASVLAGGGGAASAMAKHFGKWESGDMKRAHVIADCLATLRYRQEDVNLLGEIFGSTVNDLVEGDVLG